MKNEMINDSKGLTVHGRSELPGTLSNEWSRTKLAPVVFTRLPAV